MEPDILIYALNEIFYKVMMKLYDFYFGSRFPCKKYRLDHWAQSSSDIKSHLNQNIHGCYIQRGVTICDRIWENSPLRAICDPL